MKKNHFTVLSLTILLACSLWICAQEPDIIPKSPEVANLGSYGNIQIGEYTGIPNISIPLHTIQIGNIEVPISLAYDASGIKVKQEATNVGLGWNLIAGGNIMYEAVGANDLDICHGDNNCPTKLSWEAIERMGKKTCLRAVDRECVYNNQRPGDCNDYYDEHGYGYYLINSYNQKQTECMPELSFNFFSNAVANGGMGEPDIYRANFLNYSFKYIISPRTGLPFFIDQKNKCRINFDGETIIITGEDGSKYYFSDVERKVSSNEPNCWYISKIEDLSGNKVVFSYTEPVRSFPLLPLTERYIEFGGPYVNNVHNPGAFRSVDISNFYVDNIYLDNIVSYNSNEIIIEEVDFKYTNGDRVDINSEGVRRLDGIVVKDRINNKPILEWKFENANNYFESSNVGGDYLARYGTEGFVDLGTSREDLVSKRLKLNKIKQVDPNNPGIILGEYIFEYNEQHQLPKKTSYAVDFWGYYNGQENKGTFHRVNSYDPPEHTFLPDPTIYRKTHPLFKYADNINKLGANRSMSEVYATTAMLKSITYPTGGRSEFSFEPHEFKNHKYYSAEDMNDFKLSTMAQIIDYNDNDENSLSIRNDTFILKYPTELELDFRIGADYDNANWYGELIGESFIKIITANGEEIEAFYFTRQLDESHNLLNIQTLNKSITLDPGTYILSCYIPESVPEISYMNEGGPIIEASITGHSVSFLYNHKRIGGGVRIKTIKNFDNTNQLISQKEYKYINEDGTSSGQMIYPSMNFRREQVTTGKRNDIVMPPSPTYHELININSFNLHTLSASSITPTALSKVGTQVGYKRVEVIEISDQGNNGKTVSNFIVDVPSYEYEDEPFFVRPSKGKLTKKEIYDNKGELLLKEEFKYFDYDVQDERLNLKVKNTYVGDVLADMDWRGSGHNEDYGVNSDDLYRYKTFAYNLYNYYRNIKFKKSTAYFEGQSTVKTDEYSYTENYQLKSKASQTNNDETYTTRYKYPIDLINYKVCDNELIDNVLINGSISDACDESYKEEMEAYSACKNNYSIVYSGCMKLAELFLIKYNNCSENNGTALAKALQPFKDIWCHNAYYRTYVSFLKSCSLAYNDDVIEDNCGEDPIIHYDNCLNSLIDLDKAYYQCVLREYGNLDEHAQIYVDMDNANIKNQFIEKQEWITKNNSASLIAASFSKYDNISTTSRSIYKPVKLYQFESDSPIPHAYYTQTKSEENESTNINTLVVNDKYQLKQKLQYDNNSGNLNTVQKENDINISYYWAYKNQYPIIKAEGVDHESLNSAVLNALSVIGKSEEELLSYNTGGIGDMTTVDNLANWKAFIGALLLQPELTKAMVTAYTYKPLVGMTSQTAPDGKTIRYQYDNFGRLLQSIDHNGKVIEKYEYNYAK